MNTPLRILGVLDVPWDARLGASRVYLGLSQEWEKAGHSFEKFCLTDAFPVPTASPPLTMLRRAMFPFRAARFIRQNASRFDVIDALLGTLPFSKEQLGFNRLLVGRSIGLDPAYQEFARYSKKRWPDQPRGKWIGTVFYSLVARYLSRNAARALRRCDLVNLINPEEKQFLPHNRFIIQPNGLNEMERTALAGAAESTVRRLARQEICFVGMWGLRKGSRDWPELVRAIRGSLPDARFSFLGTMVDAAVVQTDLKLNGAIGLSCVSSFERAELPKLLAPCALGLFPSYVEGFGLSVVEQLAAGIPVIAYDVPGPRHILRSAPELLVPVGDVKEMASRAARILRMSETDYGELSVKCRRIAEQFRWEQIATDTIREYAAVLDRERSQTSALQSRTISV